jgi:hypothetical protein
MEQNGLELMLVEVGTVVVREVGLQRSTRAYQLLA